MTYRGHIRNGQVALDEPALLPEGAAVSVEVVEPAESRVQISRPQRRMRLQPFTPIEIPGGSLADELVKDRR